METNEYLKLFILTLCTLKESTIDSRILSIIELFTHSIELARNTSLKRYWIYSICNNFSTTNNCRTLEHTLKKILSHKSFLFSESQSLRVQGALRELGGLAWLMNALKSSRVFVF